MLRGPHRLGSSPNTIKKLGAQFRALKKVRTSSVNIASKPRRNRRKKEIHPTKSPVLRAWRKLSPKKKIAAAAAAAAAPFIINHSVHKWIMQPVEPLQIKRPTIALKYRKFHMVPKDEMRKKLITPETISEWKRIVAGEVATSLIDKGASLDSVSKNKWEIAERIAESVMNRQNQPGWSNMSYLEIIKQSSAYQTYDSSTYHKEIAFQPEAKKLADKVVEDLLKRGKPKHKPATHYFMRRKYALDKNGKVIYKHGKPILSTKPDPYWTKEVKKRKSGEKHIKTRKTKKLKPVAIFEYTDSKSKDKGPMMVYFYRRKN